MLEEWLWCPPRLAELRSGHLDRAIQLHRGYDPVLCNSLQPQIGIPQDLSSYRTNPNPVRTLERLVLLAIQNSSVVSASHVDNCVDHLLSLPVDVPVKSQTEGQQSITESRYCMNLKFFETQQANKRLLYPAPSKRRSRNTYLACKTSMRSKKENVETPHAHK